MCLLCGGESVFQIDEYGQMVAETTLVDWTTVGAEGHYTVVAFVATEQERVGDDTEGACGNVECALGCEQVAVYDAVVEHFPVASVAISAADVFWCVGVGCEVV